MASVLYVVYVPRNKSDSKDTDKEKTNQDVVSQKSATGSDATDTYRSVSETDGKSVSASECGSDLKTGNVQDQEDNKGVTSDSGSVNEVPAAEIFKSQPSNASLPPRSADDKEKENIPDAGPMPENLLNLFEDPNAKTNETVSVKPEEVSLSMPPESAARVADKEKENIPDAGPMPENLLNLFENPIAKTNETVSVKPEVVSLSEGSEVFPLDVNSTCSLDSTPKESIVQTTEASIQNDDAMDEKDIEEKHIEKKDSLVDDDVAVEMDDWRHPNAPLEELLKGILVSMGITSDIWQLTDNEEFYQVTFLVRSSASETVLNLLQHYGIGVLENTFINALDVSICIEGTRKIGDSGVDPISDTESSDNDGLKQFALSVKSRMTVEQVVQGVMKGSTISFDYIMLIILASMIAALGLVENSSVVLVASMLVSPLMGPILGATFGTVIKNTRLRDTGVKNETIGLAICVLCGFLFGLLSGGVNLHGAHWGSSDSWPTTEMYSRGKLRSLWVGVCIALPSGAGVALSILGGNAGSLVGVAISASLLPPAVNAGMLWAYSLITAIQPPDIVGVSAAVSNNSYATTTNSSLVNGSVVLPSVGHTQHYPPNCPKLLDNAYSPIYSCSIAQEAAILGSVSLLLTLLNIICILIMGIIVLMIKEVAPHTAGSRAVDIFWKNDISVARDSYKTHKGTESAELGKKFLEEWQKLNEAEPGSVQSTTQGSKAADLKREWMQLMQDIENDPVYLNVRQRLPGTRRPLPFSQELSEMWNWSDDEDSESLDEHYHTIAGNSRKDSNFVRNRHSSFRHVFRQQSESSVQAHKRHRSGADVERVPLSPLFPSGKTHRKSARFSFFNSRDNMPLSPTTPVTPVAPRFKVTKVPPESAPKKLSMINERSSHADRGEVHSYTKDEVPVAISGTKKKPKKNLHVRIA